MLKPQTIDSLGLDWHFQSKDIQGKELETRETGVDFSLRILHGQVLWIPGSVSMTGWDWPIFCHCSRLNSGATLLHQLWGVPVNTFVCWIQFWINWRSSICSFQSLLEFFHITSHSLKKKTWKQLKIIENISSDPWNILEPWPCQAMCPSWTSWPWVSSEATANLLSHTLTSDIRTLVRGAFDDFDGPESTIWWTHIGNHKAHIWYIMIWFSLSGAHTCSGHPPKILNLDLHCIDLFQVPTADWCVSSRYIYI